MTSYRLKLMLASNLFIFSLLVACKEAKRSPVVPAVDSAAYHAMESRSRLIEALKDVRRIVASKDSLQVAEIFRFPFPDSMIAISGDSAFESEKAKSGGNVSKALFLSGYGEFVQELQFQFIEDAYRNLNIDKLKMTDSLGFTDTTENKVCVHLYSIWIKQDSLIEFEATEYPNSGYKGHGSEVLQCEEYLLDWEFVFDGKRLQMRFHSEAD